MLKQVLTIGLLLFTITGFSQSKLTPKQISKNNYQEVIVDRANFTDINVPDKFPMYPDGIKGIYSHILRNLKYPPNALKRGVQGNVMLRFVVDESGTIKETEVIQSVDPELDAEAIRVVKSLKRWVPGYKDGNPLKVEYQFPFTFKH